MRDRNNIVEKEELEMGKQGEQEQYTYSLRSGRFKVEDTQPD